MSVTGEATLSFFGAAGGVTGSKHLVTTARSKVLLDCGQFQGLKGLRLRNWDKAPFDPKSVDAVVLSHGHIDHSGWLPALVRQGYGGPVYCTPGTKDVLDVLLYDSARLQMDDAARANRKGYTKHKPALPLFDERDVANTMRRLVVVEFGTAFAAAPGVSARFTRAGHILGAAVTHLTLQDHGGLELVYSGDLGRFDETILRPPDFVEAADVLLIESTYGDRVHMHDAKERLAAVVNEAASRGGALLIPAFAVDRTQDLLWMLRELEEQGAVPKLPVYVDSPMANRISEVYCRHEANLGDAMLLAMDQKRCPLCCRRYNLVTTAEESKALNSRAGPLVIIAGSGMASGGRILHHFIARIGSPETTVLLVGYQAVGTRGRLLRDGKAATLRIFSQEVRIRAKVEVIDGLSAHADRDDILRWLRGFVRPPAATWIVHGEPPAAIGLAEAIRRELGWKVNVAQDGRTVPLTSRQA
jgi:metallo-beta-lactamase family protein